MAQKYLIIKVILFTATQRFVVSKRKLSTATQKFVVLKRKLSTATEFCGLEEETTVYCDRSSCTATEVCGLEEETTYCGTETNHVAGAQSASAQQVVTIRDFLGSTLNY